MWRLSGSQVSVPDPVMHVEADDGKVGALEYVPKTAAIPADRASYTAPGVGSPPLQAVQVG
jgi:hypothetical protein